VQFSDITYTTWAGDSPARVNRKTRELYINKAKWPSIAPEHRVFILLHEMAHCYLDSSNEYAVDELAFQWYLELGYSLTEAVRPLSTILNTNNDSHILRTEMQLDRAKVIDYHLNNNKVIQPDFLNTKDMIDFIGKGCACKGKVRFMDRERKKAFSERLGFDDYSGCQPNESPKDCRKRIRVEGNAQRKINRSEGFRLKREAKATLAEQGIKEPGFGEQIGKAFKGIGKVVGDVGARWKGNPTSDDLAAGGGGNEAPKSNTMLYVGIGIAVVLVLGVVVFFVTKKK